ncbi:MAG: Xaa-Pro peptidase family protein [Candidatus Bathyarchaeia archaeon]
MRAEMENERMDCYVITSPSTIYYLTGYRESVNAPLLLILTLESRPILLVHRMNYTLVKEYAKGCVIKSVSSGSELVKKASAELRKLNIKKVCLDELPASWYLSLKTELSGAKLTLKPEVAWRLRRVKDSLELQLLRQAARISVAGMKAALESLRAGVREYEIAAEAEYTMRKEGSEGVAFETIVSSGRRSAWPHGLCGDRKLAEGDAVILDIGAMYAGYRSDISRTAFVGQPSPDQANVYRAVCSAQEFVLSEMKIGMCGGEVDALARAVLRRYGYARYMLHGLGHGVGIDIHEPPRLGVNSKDLIEEESVVTVEPGVYIEGKFGVRIEDTVAVHKGGLEVLTSCEKLVY